MLLGVLLCLLATGAHGASRFHERNHTGLLFLYAFDEGQVSDSLPTHIRDVSGRQLMGNLTASATGAVSWSASRQGMSIPSSGGGARAVSTMNSSMLVSRLGNEFSMEVFISNPYNPLWQGLSIAGFGSYAPGSPFETCATTPPVSYGGWHLYAHVVDAVEFSTTIDVNGGAQCVTIGVPVILDTLRHIVVRARDGIVSMRSHGSNIMVESPVLRIDPALWARHPSPLTIASPHAESGWTGTMYMVAFYNRYLSNAEIDLNMILGPPNSFPYAETGTVAGAENMVTTLVGAV
jgi:hypothetical protein